MLISSLVPHGAHDRGHASSHAAPPAGCGRRAGPPGAARLLVLAFLLAAGHLPLSGRAHATPTGCRWASAVVAFSSEWLDSPLWGAQQALGPPDTYPQYGDISSAWASLTENGQREFLELAFPDPAPINFVNVYETLGAGAIDRIAVKNPNSGVFETVWTGTGAAAPPVARVFTAMFPATPFAVSEIRIELDSPAVDNWNEVDAVSIGLCDAASESQWAAGVVAFSSEYTSDSYSAQQVLGPPDVYPLYGDDARAWSPATADGQREFLELEYDPPGVINFVGVAETLNPGSLDRVAVKDPSTGNFETVWSATAAAAPPVARIFTAFFPVTPFAVRELRLEFDSPAVSGWNEADAVGMGRCVCSDALLDAPGQGPGAVADALAVPWPNPFRGSTGLGFSLRREGHVRIEVFNVLGQRVARLVDRRLPAGRHQVDWDGTDAGGRRVAGGVYLVRLDVEGVRRSRKVVKAE